MRIPHRVCAAAFMLLPAFIFACGGDSTGPVEPQTAAQFARLFDSMYVSLWSRATTCEADYVGHRACDIYFLELVPAFGTKPVDVDVTYNGGVEHWKGVEVERYNEVNGAATDDTWWVAAYSADDLQHYFIAYSQGSSVISVLFVDDSTELHASEGNIETSSNVAPGSCKAVGGLVNPWLDPYAGYACSPATFTTSLGVAFPGPGDAELTIVEIHNAQISGERFVNVQTSTGATRTLGAERTRVSGRARSVDSPVVPE